MNYYHQLRFTRANLGLPRSARRSQNDGRNYRRSSNDRRNQKGNILLLVLACSCLILVPLLMLAAQGGLYAIDRDRAKSAVEAAALVAANDLSRVIVNDSDFGYVSLSNFPPNGEATKAPDGEPLPVTSINTLVGTVRQLAILGHEIQNKWISELAEDDRESLQSTIDELNTALNTAVGPSNKDLQSKTLVAENTTTKGGKAKRQKTVGSSFEKLEDNHGQKIEIEKDVADFLKANLPPSLKLESVEIENGWLSSAARTAVPLPSPSNFAHVEKGQALDNEYRAFVDVPFGDKSYTFAGVGKSSSLVSPADFCSADDDHINSIVKVKATFTRNSSFKHVLPFGLDAPGKIEFAAAAQPYSMDDNGPAGVMTMRFCGSTVQGMHTWTDLLEPSNFRDRMTMTYQSIGGDYPIDPLAKMRPSKLDSADGASQQFAEHLYYWLRNGHLRPRVGAVMDMLSQRFQSRPNDLYAYEFKNDGSISRRIIAKSPFPPGVTSEGQVSTTVDTSTTAGLNPIIIFRNNVKRLGIHTGGKHAGQPIAGSPLNWCELAEYGGDDFIAGAVHKGRLATGLTLQNPLDAKSSFKGADGKTVSLQPRRSYYSGGLAVDIEIGGLVLPTEEMDTNTISLIKQGRGGYTHP